MRLTRTRTVLALGAAAALFGATAAAASESSTITVSTGSINGTRTLKLLDLQGNDLAGGSLPIGTGNSGAFVAAVVDANYKHVGYQVTSTMTNMYPYSGGTYQTGATDVPSGNVSVSFPTAGLQLDNVSNLVQPVFTIAGDLTGTLSATALSLLPLGTDLTTFSTTVDGLVNPVTTVASHVVDGTLAGLPLQVQNGTTGNYTNAASLQPDGTVNETGATSLLLMQGTAQSVDPTALTSQLPAVGTSVSTLISDGLVSQDSVLSAVAAALGIPVTDLTTSVIAPLTTTANGVINGVLGQSGTYNSMPELQVTVPSTVPAGTYQGVLTVTLADQ